MANPSQYGYSQWMPHNIEVIKRACTVYLNTTKKREIVAMLCQVASQIVDYIDGGSAIISNYTFNLHDATGAGVYADGRLYKYIPVKQATKRQSSGFFHRNEYWIDGNEYLNRALEDAATSFSKGIWLVVMSAVPYAYFANEGMSCIPTNPQFFKKTVSEMINKVLQGLKPIVSNAQYSSAAGQISNITP